jgi:hypothetical protein
MGKGTMAIVSGVVGVAILAGTAFAAKPSSTLGLVVLPPEGISAAATSQPSHGDEITFDVSTNQTDRPFVSVRCYQGGTFVYDGWHGFFASYASDPIYTLASTYWTSGAADCTARLVYFASNGRERTLASMDFHVTP